MAVPPGRRTTSWMDPAARSRSSVRSSAGPEPIRAMLPDAFGGQSDFLFCRIAGGCLIADGMRKGGIPNVASVPAPCPAQDSKEIRAWCADRDELISSPGIDAGLIRAHPGANGFSMFCVRPAPACLPFNEQAQRVPRVVIQPPAVVERHRNRSTGAGSCLNRPEICPTIGG